jgi:hypothetical protein
MFSELHCTMDSHEEITGIRSRREGLSGIICYTCGNISLHVFILSEHVPSFYSQCPASLNVKKGTFFCANRERMWVRVAHRY